MSDVTRILAQVKSGDPRASAELLPIVYEELRRLARSRMAQERADHTLQSTALVHEAYLRLVDTDVAQHWDSRGHFFAAAAEAMRRILIESARAKQSLKNGDGLHRVPSEGLELAAGIQTDPDLLLDINEGISRLAVEDAEAAELVKLRLFAGLSVTEAGEMLGMSRSAAYRSWDYVRCWFAVRSGLESKE
jgi:RNA polymerase sigma factor (TIGR02999 family)